MKKRILMIGTGGTIASEESGEGLRPKLDAQGLLLPGKVRWCEVECLQLYQLDSTNMRPENWLGLARAIRENYAHFDGFVILHGTDTMAYTAAALSYLVQNSPKPIVLTGAQKPIWFDGTDSRRNLTDAFLYACQGCSGVQIVFDGHVILGTRARKTHAKSFQAFASVNYPELAVIRDERLFQYIRREPVKPLEFSEAMNPNVGVLKLIPGIDSGLLEFMIAHYDGIIVESFGVGGLPEYGNFFELLCQAIEKGKAIVMTTQVPNEGSDLSVYHVGSRLKRIPGLLEAFDMTTEAAVAKLMWLLGQEIDTAERKRLFYTEIAGDILYHG